MITTFEEYIENLARLHPLIQHELGGKCHYSGMADDSQSRMAAAMYYPCIVLDSGDFSFNGNTGNVLLSDEWTLFFLEHIKDTGNAKEIQTAFKTMKGVLLDFARKFSRDKRTLRHKFLNRITIVGSEAHRICMKDAGLYGWVLFFNADTEFHDLDCEHIFD